MGSEEVASLGRMVLKTVTRQLRNFLQYGEAGIDEHVVSIRIQLTEYFLFVTGKLV